MAELNEQGSTAVAEVPHPVFVLSYGQKDITSDITPYVLSVTYTDYLSGQSDEIEVVLEDSDGRWSHAWYPGKGDTLSLKIGYEREPLLPCGAFEIDEVEMDESPATVTIRALSTGIKKPVRTNGSRAYESTTLAAIAGRVAKRNHLTLTGRIRDIRIDRVTQYQERDVEFLTRLGREYGYAFKIVGTKLVFTELANLRDGTAVTTIKKADRLRLNLRDKIKAIYHEAKAKYHDPKTKKLVSYTLKNDQITAMPASSDTLRVTSRAGSKAGVESKARAALENTNLQQTSGSVTVIGNPKLVAGNTFDLAECGRFAGKYLSESARHRLDRSGGYTTELEIKRVAPPQRGQSAATRKKASGKGLRSYGIKDDKMQVVDTTPQQGKKK